MPFKREPVSRLKIAGLRMGGRGFPIIEGVREREGEKERDGG